MLYSNKNRRNKSNKALFLYVIAALLLIAFAAGVYWQVHNSGLAASKKITRAGNIPQATGSNPTSTTPPPPKKPTNNTLNAPGGGADTNGQTAATTNSSQWITSKSGAITVEQPTANAVLRSGDYLVGTAKGVSTVDFRISDTSVGQIATGTLQVVNGKFSGKLGFSSHSSDGELDVFSTNSQGVELNEIQIAVKFQ